MKTVRKVGSFALLALAVALLFVGSVGIGTEATAAGPVMLSRHKKHEAPAVQQVARHGKKHLTEVGAPV